MRQLGAIRRGERKPSRSRTFKPTDVKAVRADLGQSQSEQPIRSVTSTPHGKVMKTFTRPTHLVSTALFVVRAIAADAQADTASIRQRMESNQRLVARKLIATADESERSRLVDQISNVRASAMLPELRASLTVALKRENIIQRDRARRSRDGESLGDQVDAELQLKLVERVVAFNDPASIDALAGVVGTGGRAVNGIADFGVQAVDPGLAARCRGAKERREWRTPTHPHPCVAQTECTGV